jgi:hypothetical protein
VNVGVAAVDITPELDRNTIWHRAGTPVPDSVTVLDRLYARATAFRNADELAIWVSLDVCVMSGLLRQRILEAFGRSGIRATQIALSSTHTHSAPTGHDFHGVVPMAPRYVDVLVARTAEAMVAAARSTRPAELSFGEATVDLSVNRRQIGRMAAVNDIDAPTGDVDSEVGVIRIGFEDGGTGLLVNYAAHPLTMTRMKDVISADFPGRAMSQLRQEGNAIHAQFLQGCAGDVNVKISGEGAADRAGRILARAVLDASESARPSDSRELRTAEETVRLPWGRVPTVAEARETLREARAARESGKDGTHWREPWAEKLVSVLEAGDVPEGADVLIQAIRVGDAVFVALPGEVFSRIGLEIKRRAGLRHVFVVAYANNGEIGYVPTAAAFPEGGMEVDVSPYYYGLFQLAPDCERIMVAAALDLISRVCA